MNNYDIAYFFAEFCERVLNSEIKLKGEQKKQLNKFAMGKEKLLAASRDESKRTPEMTDWVDSLAKKINKREGMDDQFLKLLKIEIKYPWRYLYEEKEVLPPVNFVVYGYLNGADCVEYQEYQSNKAKTRIEFMDELNSRNIEYVYCSEVYEKPQRTVYKYNKVRMTVIE